MLIPEGISVVIYEWEELKRFVNSRFINGKICRYCLFFKIYFNRFVENYLFLLIHKYYFSDIGIRNLLTGFNLIGSIEKIMENVVYNHLRAWGWNVTVGILRAGEIDFVATKDSRKVYIQVTYLLGSEETIEREFGNLNSIKDHYPKMVVSMDTVGGELPKYPGIMHYPLRHFLKIHF